MEAWKRILWTTVAYILIPVYSQYSSPTNYNQALGWNFFYWTKSLGWNFMPFTYTDFQNFTLAGGFVILTIVLIALAAAGYRSKSRPFAFGLMIVTFLLLALLLYGTYLSYSYYGPGYLAIPIDVPFLIAILVFSYQSSSSAQVPLSQPLQSVGLPASSHAAPVSGKFCGDCGRPISIDAKFCPGYGASTEDS